MRLIIFVITVFSFFLFKDSAVLWAAEKVVSEDAPFVYDDQGKRDPFLRLVTSGGAIVNYDKDVTVTDMVLEGIIAGEDNKNIAIINGIILQTGDKIGLYVIKDIKDTSVIIQKGEERYSLKLKKEE